MSPSAPHRAVQRLLDAGALYVGKTNLDQFATGLNGTRTPYTGAAQRVWRRDDLGWLQLGFGAGGRPRARCRSRWPPTPRAPAGCRPRSTAWSGSSRRADVISTVGLVPACKSLDCLSVMAGCIDDVDRVVRRDGRPR